MAKLERDLLHQKPGADLGQARKRKLKREKGSDVLTPAARSAVTDRTARGRISRRRGPSTRERLVGEQLKSPSLSSLEDMLTSKLGLGSRDSSSKPVSRKTRRGAVSRLTTSLFDVTQRAETQRITNPEQGTIPPKNRRVFDAHSDAAPPVMVRGGMRGMAFGRVATSRLQKQRTPRRRIDVPLRATGAEIRLPSIPFIQLGWRAVSLMMVVMMSASLLLMWKAPVFQVKAVQAAGLKRLTVNDLNAVMGTAGKSIFTINPDTLHEALSQAFPEFSKISVRINLPASVKVVVTERQPVITWTQDGVEAWVDNEGVSFPPRGVLKTALVQVEGYGTPPTDASAVSPDNIQGTSSLPPASSMPSKPSLRLSAELVTAIMALGAKMPADTVLVYDSQHGLGWNDPNGWDVFFGVEDQNMDMKLLVYQALVERLKSEGIQPALISVEYLHAPYYRMER